MNTYKLALLLFFIFNTHVFSQVNQRESVYIINQVIKNTNFNNVNNCEFTTYNKLIVTANPDLIDGKIDSIFTVRRNKKTLKKLDSTDYFLKKTLSKQHLYQTEKLSKIKYRLNKRKETILSTRMAGFKEPFFEYFALQIQPHTIYDNYYFLMEKKYINPLSINALRKYNYEIKDTLNYQNRKVYQLVATPKSKNKKNKLSVVYYIDTANYSIAKADLSSKGIININAGFEFVFDKNLNNWFPTEQTVKITKGKNKYPIKLLGETITFESTYLSNSNNKNTSDHIQIKSTTVFSNPKFNVYTEIKKPSISIEIKDKTNSKKEYIQFKTYNDSLDIRSNPTYMSLDSLVEKRRIENKIQIGRKVIKGYFPVGFFDVDLRYLIRYNNFEGFRLGLGGITNEKLSKTYKLEGYYVYGTKDGVFKGSIANSFQLNKSSQTWIGTSYTDDLKEIASTSFEVDKRVFKIYDPRPFNITTFYNHRTWKGFLETKLIPKMDGLIQVSSSIISPKFDYTYKNNGMDYQDFKVSLLTASFQWNPYSNFMKTPVGNIEINKNYPKFTFQFSRTLSNFMGNNFNFGKADIRIDYQKKFNSNHKLLFLVKGGLAFGDVPLTHLYNHSPNNLNKEAILQRMNFGGKDTFETMFFNEFFSNRYFFSQVEHQFPKLIVSNKIKPIFSLVSRFGIGDLDKPENHQKINFKRLNQGFMESGVEINNIFKGLGLAGFYRYGTNQLPRLEDNIAIKLSFQLDLGFNN